jgi:4-diphosphocytidyl-2-C-methyl-D-erythritol kinase
MKNWMLRAYAKINLGLRITGKRADGYHDLDTCFLQISLADRLFFEKLGEARLEFTCNWPELPANHKNLCVRAYDLITRKAGSRSGLRLHLQKRIPFGSGLGGGSSDAAVTLMAVNRLHDLGLPKKDLHEFALQLGSDVPFFLEGGLCRGQGRGEILSPKPEIPPVWVLLATPGISVSTASVYKNIKLGLTKSRWNSTFALSKLQYFAACNPETLGINELEDVVFQWYPQLSALRDNLLKQGAMGANMTGSGSAVFGVFSSYEEARQAQQAIRSEYRTFIARPVKWGYEDVESFLR